MELSLFIYFVVTGNHWKWRNEVGLVL